MHKYTGELALLLVALIWGSGFVATAISLELYTPFQSMAIRFFIGASLLMLVFHQHILSIRRETLIRGIILGIILYIAFALQTVGLAHTTPAKNAFLTAVNVVAVPFIAYLLFQKKINRYEFIGAILSLFGIALLSIDRVNGINIGDLLTLCCAIAFAFHIIYTGIFVKKDKAIQLTLIQFVTAAFIGFIFIGIRGELHFPMETKPLLALFYLGIFSTGIAFLMQTIGQKFVTETKAAILLSTEAVWGMFFSIIIMKEWVTLQMFSGAIIILIAILVTELKASIFPFLYKKKA